MTDLPTAQTAFEVWFSHQLGIPSVMKDVFRTLSERAWLTAFTQGAAQEREGIVNLCHTNDAAGCHDCTWCHDEARQRGRVE